MSILINMYTHLVKLIVVGLLLSVNSAFGQNEEGTATLKIRETVVEIRDFSFNPQSLTVKAGDKITWINHDEEPHTIVSVEKQFKRSQALDTGDTFTITAGAPGTYTYYCSVHPKMTGAIVVKP